MNTTITTGSHTIASTKVDHIMTNAYLGQRLPITFTTRRIDGGYLAECPGCQYAITRPNRDTLAREMACHIRRACAEFMA